MTRKQPAVYKDADEAFEAYCDALRDNKPANRAQLRWIDAWEFAARRLFAAGWCAHADMIREKTEPLSRIR